jgi:hypothetical protein
MSLALKRAFYDLVSKQAEVRERIEALHRQIEALHARPVWERQSVWQGFLLMGSAALALADLLAPPFRWTLFAGIGLLILNAGLLQWSDTVEERLAFAIAALEAEDASLTRKIDALRDELVRRGISLT